MYVLYKVFSKILLTNQGFVLLTLTNYKVLIYIFNCKNGHLF